MCFTVVDVGAKGVNECAVVQVKEVAVVVEGCSEKVIEGAVVGDAGVVCKDAVVCKRAVIVKRGVVDEWACIGHIFIIRYGIKKKSLACFLLVSHSRE